MSTRQVLAKELGRTPREWWGASAALLVIGILMMSLSMSVWAYGQDLDCGSVFSTLDRPFDWKQADDGDGHMCADDLADRGAQGVTLLILAGFTGLVGVAARRWKGLAVPAIAGGLVILHLAWPMTVSEDDPNSDGLRCGSPLLTSTPAFSERAFEDNDLEECAHARSNRLSRAALVGILAVPLSMAVVSRRRPDQTG